MNRPALALALGAALASCGEPGPLASPVPAPPPAPERPAPDAVHLVAPEPVRRTPRLVATGTLKARESAALALSVPGTLRRIAVRRGQEVREGVLLASLDDAAARAAVRQAEAAVAAAGAQLALAEDALARATRIGEQDGIAEAQLVQVRSQRALAAAQLAVAEAQLDQAKVTLDHHHLRAPFAGAVTRVPDGVGITVAAGTPVVTLVGTRRLVLETSLTQEEAAELRPGDEVEVSVPATGARSGAKVAVIVPAVDPATNRVPVEISVPNEDGRFLPNAFARAEASLRARAAFRIPAAALVQRGGAHAAWIVGADGRARGLPVRLLVEEGDVAVVLPEGGSWPEGVRVVGAPPLGIADGTVVAEGGR